MKDTPFARNIPVGALAQHWHDPIPVYVMQTGKMVTYEAALAEIKLTPEQEAFVERARAARAFDSMAMPVYGPFDFDTYAAFPLGWPFGPEDELIVQRAVAGVGLRVAKVGRCPLHRLMLKL